MSFWSKILAFYFVCFTMLIIFCDPFKEDLPILDIIPEDRLNRGASEMAKHKLVIVGITRDNAFDLLKVIVNVERTGLLFKDYKVIIVENDSKDGTKEILNNWAKNNHKVKIISKNYHLKKRPSIQFLADLRNKYLEAVQSNEKYSDFDLMMVLDMDMGFGWDIRGIQDTFSKFDEWDMVCANGIFNSDLTMYDAFAFRSEEFSDDVTTRNYWKESIRKIWQKVHRVNEPLFEVDSCFGGMAFYKKRIIGECRYASPNNDCEHVKFHKCLKDSYKSRNYLNPNLLIRYRHYEYGTYELIQDLKDYISMWQQWLISGVYYSIFNFSLSEINDTNSP